MSRHLRSRHGRHEDGGDDPVEDGGFRDDNGIIHTSSRSLRKINYAEIESGFDFLENEDNDQPKEPLVVGGEPASDPATGAGVEIGPGEDPKDVFKDDEEDEGVVGNGYGPQSNGEGGGNRTRRARSRGRKVADPDEDDESFHEDDIEEEEDEDDVDSEVNFAKDDDYYIRRRRQREDKNFVVPDPEEEEGGQDDDDDDDDDEGISYYRGRKRRGKAKRERSPSPSVNVARRLRRRTRSAYAADAQEDDEMEHGERPHDAEALSLRDEIRELQDDSPIQEKRSLRERTKPVNYKLPPPLTEASAENYLERQAVANAYKNPSPRGRRGGGHYNHNTGPARRLFPTGGPFGGNDVTTIFGKNTNFYHQGPPAVAGVGSANSNNKLILDSDSSEDEILPLGAKPKPKSDNASKRKKKQEIADLDPLGVDMSVKFEDVGGLDNYIDQLKEMVALPLLYPELYQNFDITPPRGVLFHGPPGTGKTLMARALAASCSSEGRKITFFMRKGADVLSKWVGEAERQLRLLFEEAKKQQPSVIFFDEIDGLAPVRSSKQEQIHASIVSTLLALMDGMDNRGQVIVIGATNRPDAVDPALRRPGRFDREFYFPLPDVKGRQKIIKIHTKNWKPPLSDKFIQNLATLTKGFGGADLRALCTEAALLSIQRRYPQIYRSNEKLAVDPHQVKVGAKDFMIALKKIVPSSARSSGDAAQPLPDLIRPLLQFQFENITRKLKRILPVDDDTFTKDSSLIQEYLDYEDFYAFGNSSHDTQEDDGDDEGFAKHEMLNRLSESRICNPKLLVTGPAGNGQQYVGAALLHFLEQFNVQRLDLASLLSESTRTVEAAMVQGFVEARRQQPSIIFIPNIEIWSQAIPEAAIFTLTSLFRSLKSNEKVFLLGISEIHKDTNISEGPLSHFEFSDNICHIDVPSTKQRSDYFASIVKILHMKPYEFKTRRRRRRPLPSLPLAKSEKGTDEGDENGETLSSFEALRRKLKTFQHQDMRLKNILKIKLSGLMDLFKNRYKRFRKPPIEDDYLIHLFEPPTDPNWQPAYTKDNDMILEVATGRRFFNMDLDIVEERLWNGYYSEPKQYLKDIELIYRDANTTGDRERIIKASEMFANAQMGIEDMSTPEFIRECKATRQRDLERQELFLKDEESRIAVEQRQLDNTEANPTENGSAATVVGIGDGNQLQAQLQFTESTDKNPEDSNIATGTTEGVNDKEVPADHRMEDVIPSTNDGASEPLAETTERLPKESEKTIEKGENQETVVREDDENSKLINNQNNLAQDATSDHVNPGSLNKVYTNEDSTKEKVNPNDEKQNSENAEFVGFDEKNQNMNNNRDASHHTSGTELDEYSESEDTTKELKIDESIVKKIIELLEERTEGYTVSRLQELYSKLVDIAWENRFSWDKAETMEKILHFINSH